jgi:DNA-binding transcriptional ArsR family regulator
MQLETAATGLAELGNVTRLRIFRLLVRSGETPLAVGEIQAELGIPASTLSHHISRLVWAGLVEQEREGRVLRCRPCFAALNALVEFLYEECCQAGTGEASSRRSRKGKQRRAG